MAIKSVKHVQIKYLSILMILSLAITPILLSEDVYASSELLLKFKPGVSDDLKQEILTSLGLKVVDEIPDIHVLVVSAPGNAISSIKASLSNNPSIDFVEDNAKLSPSFIPNDEYYDLQWHLEKISASEAWDKSTGDGIIVAVLDSGVDSSHSDLSEKLLQGYNFFDNDYDTSDVYGHGTKVAGVAGATTNNMIGISSIGYECSILPIRVTDTNGYAYYSLLAKGLTYAADEGAKVAVISFRIFGGSALSEAASYFMEKGGLVVAAGGNDRNYHSDPDNPYIISVSATTSSDSRASYSSFGYYIDIAAPGSGIYTTIMGGSYGSVSGTSFSAPLTAGLIALIFSANPSLTPIEVEQIIESTAVDLGSSGYDIYYGYGRIDASSALTEAVGDTTGGTPDDDTEPPSVTITNPGNGDTVSGTITINVVASDNIGVSKVDLYKDGDYYATDISEPYSFQWDTSDDYNGEHILTAKAHDASNNIGVSDSVTVNVANEIGDNIPPIVSITNPIDGSTVLRNVKISATASDESGISRVEFYIDDNLIETDHDYPYEYRWNTKTVDNGLHKIKVRAYDEFGNYAEDIIDINVSNKINSNASNNRK